VYWECRGIVVHETIHMPLGRVHTCCRDEMEDYMEAEVFSAKTRGFGSSRAQDFDDTGPEIARHIANYTHRDLKFDTDSLAFDGISDHYSNLYSNECTVRSGITCIRARVPKSSLLIRPGSISMDSF
jgi:hypothetical protein